MNRGSQENKAFIGGHIKNNTSDNDCCQKKSTSYCCYSTLGAGCVFLILGIGFLIGGESVISNVIIKSMALTPDSDRLKSWLDPPVQAHLTAYGFHVKNPESVIQGRKPIVEEVGPFVYKAVTVKDSVDHGTAKINLKYEDDGDTLTYRPRKFYFLDRAASKGDPDKTFITVPNIPFLTGMSKIRNLDGIAKTIGSNIVLGTGLATPFINVSFSGLLWGYNDELPCRSLDRPDECPDLNAVDIFNDDEDSDEDWGSDWKRKKREAPGEGGRFKRHVEKDVDLRTMNHDSITKAKAAFVDCKCEWGLFRDRNVTLRKPVRINHGVNDLKKKGLVVEYDSSSNLNWWEPNSQCDAVGGRDGGTLPPQVSETDKMELFIDLMCRKINLKFEKEVKHMGLQSLRFIPPENALGSHLDSNPKTRNDDNSCYCLENQGFSCFKSGVLNLAPCKRSLDLPKGAPIALSFPHFYQADQSFRDAVGGLNPEKEKHEFYVDISPEFGFPLAIRPRFQLNAIIQRDPSIEIMSKFSDELILPFLWAQDGFDEPSEEMAEAIRFGLAAPKKLAMIGGISLLVLGGAMCLGVLIWWLRTSKFTK